MTLYKKSGKKLFLISLLEMLQKLKKLSLVQDSYKKLKINHSIVSDLNFGFPVIKKKVRIMMRSEVILINKLSEKSSAIPSPQALT